MIYCISVFIFLSTINKDSHNGPTFNERHLFCLWCGVLTLSNGVLRVCKPSSSCLWRLYTVVTDAAAAAATTSPLSRSRSWSGSTTLQPDRHSSPKRRLAALKHLGRQRRSAQRDDGDVRTEEAAVDETGQHQDPTTNGTVQSLQFFHDYMPSPLLLLLLLLLLHISIVSSIDSSCIVNHYCRTTCVASSSFLSLAALSYIRDHNFVCRLTDQ